MADIDVLTGARVRLRAPRADDAETLYAEMTSDPVVTRSRPNTVELGYCLARRSWGSGYTGEVAELMCRTAERDPAVYRISAYCHVHNSRSASVLRRCGLALEGRLVRYAVFPNIGPDPQDCFLFARAVK